jgi:hypothetical protein
MGLWEGMYRLVMRRNGVYVTFVVAGAFAGERVSRPLPDPPVLRSARPVRRPARFGLLIYVIRFLCSWWITASTRSGR